VEIAPPLPREFVRNPTPPPLYDMSNLRNLVNLQILNVCSHLHAIPILHA
jgi:hypothetical protein